MVKSTAVVNMVSTITPVHNRPTLLIEAVNSVLSQTYRPVEIIIVDDGSDDGTPAAIQDLEAASGGLVISIRQSNSGPGVAREAGRQVARGEFIQYLDSDDLLLPRKFELQVEALVRNRDCGIAYGRTHFNVIGEPLREVAHKRTGERFGYLFPALLESRWWSTSTPLYRRTLTDCIGPWMPLWNEEDWEYDARAGAFGTKLCFCDAFVSVHRSHLPEEHLCFQGATDPKKLCDRAKAHELILSHAMAAGVPENQPEMQHFARELFLLARQCGSVGLAAESRQLFDLARAASTPERARGLDFRAYRALASVIGWGNAGRLAAFADRVRGLGYA